MSECKIGTLVINALQLVQHKSVVFLDVTLAQRLFFLSTKIKYEQKTR